MELWSSIKWFSIVRYYSPESMIYREFSDDYFEISRSFEIKGEIARWNREFSVWNQQQVLLKDIVVSKGFIETKRFIPAS